MCVIIVQKDKFPGWEIMKNCWDRNPHGAGYMYQDDGKVIISKGYTTFADFKTSVESIPDYDKRPLVYHFRIATHGTVVPENTHPFPVSSNVNHLKALDLKCACGIAHNGIINFKSYNEKERKKYSLSDTGQFIREITKMSKTNNSISKRKLMAYLEFESKISGSKFAMMDGKNVYTFGNFYEIEGCLFSNNHSHIKYTKFVFPESYYTITKGVIHYGK